MDNGKPNWWSRPSSTPEAARIATPPPADEADGDFPLPAPQPAPDPTPEPPATAPEPPAAAPEPPTSAPAPAVGPVVPEPAPVPSVELTKSAPEPAPEAAPVPVGAPAAQAPQPLHAPDEYRTPPYGEPGPWAPAPPVQRPPASVPPQAHHQPPHAPPAPPQGGAAPWVQYDPWAAAGAGAAPVTAKRSRKGLAIAGALVFALVTGVIGGGIGAYVERNGGLTTVELPQADGGDTGRAPDSVAGIAASALPGVVTLHVTGNGSAGTGTGFVLDTKGHILTNNHVVDGAGASGDISVTFSSGETARAKLIGKDTGYDLAVVQVTGVSGLKALPLGNSDDVRVGDPVVAIGAPFDLSNTVTSGIISAKERPITAGGEKGDGSDISYVDALQTDAPINPGNSGGPLLDSKARVIGINSAIRAASGSGEGEGEGASQPGSIGLGFAIPINQGKRVAEELINTGKATHPVIGVSLDMQFNGDGARVGEKGKDGSASVTAGGPAAKAGLRPGDVITKVDGQRVHNGEELIVKIRAHRPGDRLELTLTRNGKELTKTLTLGSSQGT
ncbi:trypsin-like peptidase domain-containing protein [Streptomyces sp. SP18ES09]|uniref:S1C family serine protease n=1 Tax=Streptomyces sp. SP18ES09 TaxID=3002532 RepID=UPI002E7923F6|nr:trypsin-like peptidase domain-containing protein [Streptomyces sp. SP18ES09]MEE1817070.1 trypsin-like peptidase domain-containing protein [Streptomyces sp. SP18ES09]